MTATTRKRQQYKIDGVGRLTERLRTQQDIIFSDFRGLTFPQMTDLRARLTEKGTTYHVVRNTFARIAMQEAGLPDASAWLVGPTALAFLGGDPSPAAKVMVEFTKGASLQIKGGVISGRLLSVQEIEALSRLPGRRELLASLLGTMQAPLRDLMSVMNGVASKLVRTLAAVADKKGTDGEAPAAAGA
jgi:large subunit ribosomal protein L10